MRPPPHGAGMDDRSRPARPARPATAPGAPHPSTARRAGSRYRTALLEELDREWERLGRRPMTRRAVAAWFADDGPLAGSTLATALAHVERPHLDDVLEATRHRRPHAERSLGALLALAASDELAARIVLQRVLPGLVAGARRWSSLDPDAVDVVIGAAWVAITGFGARRRPSSLAPALVSDALWIAFRRASRRRAPEEVPLPLEALGERAAPRRIEPMVALAEALRAARAAGVSEADLGAIRALAAAGSPSAAARALQVTPRTVRNRRDAAGRRIRDALGPDWHEDDHLPGAA